MIYVTGDMHGDLSRFKHKALRRLKKNDFLIVCGDFGFVWDGSQQEQKKIKWIAHRRYTTLFIDGVHENFELLAAYPEQELFGGKVRCLGKRLFYLERGQVFELEGKKIFAMGGGEREDREVDDTTSAYLTRELPTKAEIEQAAFRLEDTNYSVDCVITYEAATTIKSSLVKEMENINPLNAFFERVLRECRYKKWFFGCYHVDRKLSHVQHAVFREVLPVEDVVLNKKKKKY